MTDDVKTIINVKGVSKSQWEAAKRGSAQTGESMGAWLSGAIAYRTRMDATAITPPGLAPVKNDHDLGNPPMSEDQLTARMQAVAALMQGLAAVKTATGRASGRDVVMGAVWKLEPERRRLAARANGHAAEGEP